MTLNEFIADWHSPSPTLLVHTSGSTGKPKPMLVEKRRMEASARMTCRFLNLKEGDTALLHAAPIYRRQDGGGAVARLRFMPC